MRYAVLFVRNSDGLVCEAFRFADLASATDYAETIAPSWFAVRNGIFRIVISRENS